MFVVRSGSTVIVHAPAKLNLHLEILARRNDGFHELETLMTAAKVFDTLEFVSVSGYPESPGEIHFECRWAYGWSARMGGDNAAGDLPPVRQNIAFRAVEALRRRAGVSLGARIRLIKRIPSAAGLGGASSDAVAALLAANEGWKLNWPVNRLAEIAAELGSDVPFFLATGERGPGAAVCRGRGELIESVGGMSRLNYVIVRPPQGLSTPEVYRHCRPAEKPVGSQELLAAARVGNPAGIGGRLTNGLEEPAAGLSPWVGRLRGEMSRVGSLGGQMSGSGSSYFGIFRSARQARRAATRLRGARLGAVHCAATAAAPRRRGTDHNER